MALVVKDRVKETTTTTGTGTVTLGGAASGYQSFSVVGDGNTTYYSIIDVENNDWEVGLGTYTASGTTLSRDTVLESSNAGSLVNFSAGTKTVFSTYPAEKAAFIDDINNLATVATSGSYNDLSNLPTIPTNNNQLTNGAGYTTNVGDITGVTAGTNLSGGGTSGTVTLNLSSTPSLTSVTLGSGCTLQESTDRADTLQITSSTSSWGGLQIRNSSNEGRWSFMTDGSSAGIYDDENGDWVLQASENGAVTLYHNGVSNFSTGSSYLEMAKPLDMNNLDIYGVDQIFHHGDTNTYMQFHAEDQWRVVTGGSERLEVNNSAVTVPGTLNVRGAIDLADNDILRLGSSDDCEFFCNGSHMYMDLNGGIGNFYIRDGTTTRYTFNDNGSFTATGNVTAYSDARLKDEIEVIDDALAKVNQLRGVTFVRTDEEELGRQSGVIAQEVEAVLPEVVLTADDDIGTKSVAYGNMVGLLIEAVKELTARVEDLEAKQ